MAKDCGGMKPVKLKKITPKANKPKSKPKKGK